MKIKVDERNKDKIEDVLAKANGKAVTHTMWWFTEVDAAARSFEKALEDHFLLKKDRAGAVCKFRPSGKNLAKSYNFGAITTEITLERRASGWFLTNAIRSRKFPQQDALREMHLSVGQVEIIKSKAISHALKGVKMAEESVPLSP